MKKIIGLIISIHACCFAMTISINDYLIIINENHTMPKQIESQLHSVNHGYNAELYSQTDWLISASTFQSKTKPNQASSFTPNSINSLGTEFSLTRSFLTTGGTLDIRLINQKVNQSPLSYGGTIINQPNFFENNLLLTYTQPLLLGSFGQLNKLPILIASSNKTSNTLALSDQYETFILNEMTQFMDWMLQHELTELKYRHLQLARKQKKHIQKRVQVNLSEKVDLIRSNVALEQSYQSWKIQKTKLKSLQAKLSTKYNTPLLSQSKPSFPLYQTDYIKKPDYIIPSRLRIFKQLDAQTDLLNYQTDILKNQRNGSLDLQTQLSLHNGNNSFNDSLKLTKDDTLISINYSRPLFDTATKEDLNNQIEQNKYHDLRKKQLILDIKSEIVALYTSIQELQAILDNSLKQILLSESQYKEEEKRYNQGRSQLDIVIQSQNAVLNSKLQYAELAAMYQKNVLTYLNLTDNLLQKYPQSKGILTSVL